ncbi:SRPBCC domain-containing protein [Aeromonas veronii]|uniref:SRPBCC domain-containing protein n=1 Tax=Aeromonas veronii TaxID=654 RepID=UPI001F266C25|nr:SRPBCC domain-containing protein [Aeromonas veronii]MCF5889493.1 SRPBCC domain-containing protein [Aeromonas veronii]
MPNTSSESLYSIVIPAPIKSVWDEFTTENGVRNFMAPVCHVIAQPNGPFEIFFENLGDNNEQSSKGSYFLSVIPHRLLSLSWSFSSRFPSLKNQKILICIYFKSKGDNTLVSFYQEAGLSNGDWAYGCEFSRNLWENIFLPRLKRRFMEGPIDWSSYRIRNDECIS